MLPLTFGIYGLFMYVFPMVAWPSQRYKEKSIRICQYYEKKGTKKHREYASITSWANLLNCERFQYVHVNWFLYPISLNYIECSVTAYQWEGIHRFPFNYLYILSDCVSLTLNKFWVLCIETDFHWKTWEMVSEAIGHERIFGSIYCDDFQLMLLFFYLLDIEYWFFFLVSFSICYSIYF